MRLSSIALFVSVVTIPHVSFALNSPFCDHGAYPVDKVQSGTAKPNVRSTAFARRFKTVISSHYKPIAEFAGHYHIVSWGCGTQCHQFALVDTLTGKVFEVPEPSIGYEDYRVNSKLFVIHSPSAIDQDDPLSKFPKNGFYLWDETKERFKKLKRCDASQ